MKKQSLSIKEIRKISGLSQSDFANKYEIPLTTLKKWEAPEDSSNHREPPTYLKILLEKVVRNNL